MDKRISQLDPAAALDGTEVLPVVQGGNTKKTAVSTILTWILGDITSDDITEGATNLYLNQTNFDSFWDLKVLSDLSDVDLTGLNANDVLQWDGANWIPYTLVANDTIYTADGTLTGVRTVSMGGHNIVFAGNQGEVKLTIQNTLTTEHSVLRFLTPVYDASLSLQEDGQQFILSTTNTNIAVQAGGASTIRFANGAGESFRVTSTREVGFNISNPSAFVHIRGTTDSTGTSFRVTNNSNSTIFVVKDSGFIGFGQTTPTATVHVNGTLKFVTGAQGLGKVLTSDANGVADWASLGGVGGAVLNGIGIAGYTARWLDADTIGTGAMRDNGTECAIGVAPAGTVGFQIYKNSTSLFTAQSSINTNAGVSASVRNMFNNGSQQLEIGILGTGCTSYAVLRGGVSDSFIVHNGNAGNLNIRTDDTSTGKIQFFSRKNANLTPSMTIDGDSVGINVAPNASYKLEIGGDISINNANGKLSWYDAVGATYRTLIQMSQSIGAQNIMVGGGVVTDGGNGGGVAIGANSTTLEGGISIGSGATSNGDGISIGRNSTSTGSYRAVAIGRDAVASAANAWALGWNAVASQANTFIFGDSTDGNIKSGFGTNTPTSRLHVKTALGGSGFRVEPNGNTTPAIYTNDSGMTGFGTASPNPSAIVDITSTTQGVLLPRMTTAQKNAIATPLAGLELYDTTLNKKCLYTGAAWETITSV